MPEILHRCVEKVMGQGHSEESAYAICRASLGVKEDGSQDATVPDMTDHEMLIRTASEITKRQFDNFPRVRKWMPLCVAVGDFVNGEQEGQLTVGLFKRFVENFKKHPRQIPVYLIVGDTNPEHPTDLDARLADGWVENLRIDGKTLMGDVTLNGNAAVAVLTDGVRGASIGAKPGMSYDGKDIGYILEHVVLTNSPFVKGMNVAARSQSGGELSFFFTALKQEATMAEDVKPEPDISLTEKVTALEVLLQEKEGQIRDLTASNENMREELEKRRENAQNDLLLQDKTRLERRVLAMRIQKLVAKGVANGQFTQDRVKGYDGGDDMSDEVTLAWFKGSEFKGNMDRLEYALQALPKKTMGRTFHSGMPTDDGGEIFTAAEKAIAVAAGKDPEILAGIASGKARTFTEWQALKKAAGKGA
jgi:hypothetical protein